MFKSICIPALVFALLLGIFAGCKKGPDDPRFSFTSRRNRLAGDWMMKSGKASFSRENYSEMYDFDGSRLKQYTTYAGGQPVVYIGNYSLYLTIEKDGGFHFRELGTGLFVEASGRWSFNNGESDLKKKEEVIFQLSNLDKGKSTDGFFNASSTSFVYQLKGLDKKKMSVFSSGLYYSQQGTTVKYTTEYEFEQL